jgi:hypothetical protein
MATRRYYKSTAVDNTVASNITNTSSNVVLSTTPVGFPTSYPYVVALDYGTASEELVLVTSTAGTTLNITRGFDGSNAQAHNAGAVVRHVITAADLNDVQDHIAAGPGGVHGITGAAGTFLATPTSANLAAAVTDETGSGSLVFATAPVIAMGINAQTNTSYTLVGGDAANLVTLYNTGGITVTVPPSTFSIGQAINIQQTGAGQVTVAAGSGVTITGTGTKLRTQYSAATILCTASNTFTLIGDIQ